MTELPTFDLSRQQLSLVQADAAQATVQAVLQLDAEASPDAVRAAVELVVSRHETLRSSYPVPSGMRLPVQQIHDGPPVWTVSNATPVERVMADERAAMTAGGLRAALCLHEQPSLVLTALALATDERGLLLVVSELGSVLAGDSLSEEPLQYVDFCGWQAQQPAAETALATAGSGLSIVAARPGGRAGRVSVDVGSRHEIGVEDLLATWAAVLAVRTGAARLDMGLLATGRDEGEPRDSVGRYDYAVPMSIEVSPDDSLDDVAARARGVITAAPRGPVPATVSTGAALLTWFETDDESVRDVVADGLAPLTLAARRLGGRLLIDVCYDVDAVDSKLAAALAAGVSSALDADKRLPVRELDLVPGWERSSVRASLANPVDAGDFLTVVQQFEAQVARVPERVAVDDGTSRLTYRDLDAAANRVAHKLISDGVTGDDVVAVLMDRTTELVTAVLGVLKSGAAYLVLNPEHPRQRLALQLADAGAVRVVTTHALAGLAPADLDTVIEIDRVDLTSVPDTRPEVRAGETCYVMYTSGSTGRPKGVAVTHANLAAYVGGICAVLGVDGRIADPLSFGLVTSMSTDLGNTAVFPSLATGGTLQLVPVAAAADGRAFANFLVEHPLDLLKITPSHLRALLSSAPTPASCLPRKWLVVGGEAATWDLVDVAAGAGCTVVAHYGPTECTVGATAQQLSGSDPERLVSRTLPIGRPLAGVVLDVVDANGRTVGAQMPGELLIGGLGVANGYLNMPEETEGRFVESESIGRAYRSGDVVRLLPGGSLEFLHRADSQVKIRGYRVEPDEVAAVLSEHPLVQQAVVVAREGRDGMPRLLGYVRAAAGTNVEALRLFLSERLPDFMVPSAVAVIDEFPLLSNGKVDRAALPDVDAVGTGQVAHVAPASVAEQQMAAIWEEVLGVDELSVTADFFALGGHSLLATQVIARARNAFGVELPLHVLFTAPTVRALTACVEYELAHSVPADAGDLLDELESMSDEEVLRMLDELERG
jgi:amino acid adenylation domain-containing protein